MSVFCKKFVVSSRLANVRWWCRRLLKNIRNPDIKQDLSLLCFENESVYPGRPGTDSLIKWGFIHNAVARFFLF